MFAASEHRAIVLNADHRPLSMAPPSKCEWQKAVQAVLTGTAIVVSEYDRVIRSQKRAFGPPEVVMRLPSVIALVRYVPVERLQAPLTRWNLFLTYRFTCAFCGEEFQSDDLTFEHLLPRARGGTTTWRNLLPACSPCNHRKGCRTPEEARMPVLFQPCHPTVGALNRLSVECADRHPFPDANWKDVMYWTVSLMA